METQMATKFTPGTRVVVHLDDDVTPAEYQGPGEVREYNGQSVVVELDSGHSTDVLTDFVEPEEPDMSAREYPVADRVVIIPRDIHARVLNGQGVIREIDGDKVTVDLDGGYEQKVPLGDLFFEADVLEGAITLLAPHGGEELDEEEAGPGWTLLEDPESMPFLLEEPHARRFVQQAQEDELLVYYKPGQAPGEERFRLMAEVGRCRVIYPATGAVAPVEVVDVDQLVRAAGGSPYDPEPLDLLRDADGEHTGVMRRLGMSILDNPYPEPAWFQKVGVLAVEG